MTWRPNPGKIPDECAVWSEDGQSVTYRPVHVRTFGSDTIPPFDSKRAGHLPWPSGGGRPPTNWRISRPPQPFEIREYEVQ